MSGLISLLGILVAQSSVTFVGISIILGRVYFQSYFDTLGIPHSAVSLKVTDYSIIEPQVTLMGIIMAIYVPIFFLFFMSLQTVQRFSRPRLYIGGILILAPLFIAVGVPAFQVVFFAQLAAVFSIPLGGSMMATAISFQSSNSASTEGKVIESDSKLRLSPRGIAAAFLLFAVVVVGFSVTKNYSSALAELKARLTLQEAPIANLEFKPDAQWLTHGIEECSEEDSRDCVFKIILIGDRFIYLSPVSNNTESSVSGLYAVPVSDVRYIHFLPE